MWWRTRRNQISSFGETDESFYIGGGRQFSRLLVAEMCASALIVGSNAGYTKFRGSEKATHSIRQFPLRFPSRELPCAITFQLESTSWIFACVRRVMTVWLITFDGNWRVLGGQLHLHTQIIAVGEYKRTRRHWIYSGHVSDWSTLMILKGGRSSVKHNNGKIKHIML